MTTTPIPESADATVEALRIDHEFKSQPATSFPPAHRGAEEALRVAAEVLKAGDLCLEWTERGHQVVFQFKSRSKAQEAYSSFEAALATLSSATADQTEGRP